LAPVIVPNNPTPDLKTALANAAQQSKAGQGSQGK
jgi:hypothetical protein